MAHKRPPLEIKAITASLKESKGQGVDAFFPPPPTHAADKKPSKPKEHTSIPNPQKSLKSKKH